MHLLVVYDQCCLHQFLSASLEEAGYTVHAASGEAEALHLFQQKHIDLVLLDLQRPLMEQSILCTELRKRSRVPIIVMSSDCAPDDIVISFSRGADDFIPKPFQLRDVTARIQQLLHHAPATTHPH
jgi:DNA-binding response OmpR family regulator